jgi:hypothetical protein
LTKSVSIISNGDIREYIRIGRSVDEPIEKKQAVSKRMSSVDKIVLSTRFVFAVRRSNKLGQRLTISRMITVEVCDVRAVI